jgi:fluoride exporter
MWQKLLCLALAGSLGTLARYGLAGAVHRWTGSGFPWGTVAVNALGCFLLGVFWIVGTERLAVSGETRTIVLVGFMGAFTTFSAFVGETSQLLNDSQWFWAAGNVLLQNVAGFVLFFVGAAMGRWI